jgi:hypothetical protein
MNKIKSIFQGLAYKFLQKSGYPLEPKLNIEPIIIYPPEFKKFHAQKIINWYDWHNRQITPDCYIRQFKYELMDEFIKEIQIKAEEIPEGICYSADLLFKNFDDGTIN